MFRKTIVSIIACAALSVGATSVAQAATCRSADSANPGGIGYILGFDAKDTPFDAWCRIQTLKGKYDVRLMFPQSRASIVFKKEYTGEVRDSGDSLRAMLQSAIPLSDGQILDKNGMPFALVLGNVVQLSALQTPDGSPLGFPLEAPFASELALWEKLVISVKPVRINDTDYTLTALFSPNPGKFLHDLQSGGESLRLNGWRGRLDTGNRLDPTCSKRVPLCRDLPDVVSFDLPMVLDGVFLEATGDGLSKEALRIMGDLQSGYAPFVKSSTLESFDPVTGAASLEIDDGRTHISATSSGSSGGRPGVSRIVIGYQPAGKWYAETLKQDFISARRSAVLGMNPVSQ